MTREAMIKFIKAVRKEDPNIDSVLWNMSTEALTAAYKVEQMRVNEAVEDRYAEMGL